MTTAQASGLRITVLQVPGRARIVRLDGEIDLDQRPALRRTLEAALHAPPHLVVLDLSRVAFCDVTGLNELLRARRIAEAADAALVLAGPRPQTRRLLDIAGTAPVFEVHDSVTDVLAADRRRPTVNTADHRPPERCIVTLPVPVGAHCAPQTVTVHRTGRTGPGGGAVYTDADGTLDVEVTGPAARPLSTARTAARPHPLPAVLHAHPLPRTTFPDQGRKDLERKWNQPGSRRT
ncbi:DUF6296 family protein [Streptomyces sp. TLI_171]|uniref:DUF6296 family protein n=1 Tax=Streptomyces sp. TLI_171 TaxID=1938859 RepID=UPI0015D55CF9|nr:DUF6296 family protein [Streptomyces sp. TLI_171]